MDKSELRAIRFSLSLSSKRAIMHLLQSNPLTARERLDLNPRNAAQSNFDKGNREERQRGTTGRLMGAVPQVPPASTVQTGLTYNSRVIEGVQPTIYQYGPEIIRLLEYNQVLAVFGPPGCGKTTYLPQILLDECHKQGQRCRMICTEPRRLYAHINAERVAHLRGETVGQTVGYQIRLESKVSPRTLLTFCTHGVLLRTIYADPGLIAGTTHILVDEVDEEEIHLSQFLSARNVEIRESGTALMDPATGEGTYPTELMQSQSSVITSHTEGCGMLLGMLPWLLSQYPKLKVVLLVNLRKKTFDTHQFSLHGNIFNHTSELQSQIGVSGRVNSKVSVSLERWLEPFETKNGSHRGPFTASSTEFQVPVSFSDNAMLSKAFTLSFSGIDLDSVTKSSNYSPSSTQILQQSHKIPLENLKNSEPLSWNSESVSSWNNFYEKAKNITIPYIDRKIATYFLEDILHWTGYRHPDTQDGSATILQDDSKCQVLANWLNDTHASSMNWNRSNELRDNLVNIPSARKLNTALPNETNLRSSPTTEGVHYTTEALDTGVGYDILSDENVSVASRQHAEKLIWSIWRCAVLRPAALGSPLPYIQELLTNLHQCILAGWFPVDFQHSQSGLTALMVCSAAGLVDSVERLLGFGANVLLRVPFPYEILQSVAAKDSNHLLCGPQNRRVQIGTQSYLVVGVNAYDLARLFGHRQVEALLLAYTAAQSLRHIPEHHEAVLLRYGAWFYNPVNVSPFSSHQVKCTTVSQFGFDEDTSRNLLLAYLTSRNLREPETTVDFDLLRALLKKMDSAMPEGDVLIFLPSYEEIITLRDQLLDPEQSIWDKNRRNSVLIVHSRMLVADLASLYVESSPGMRKVILSSNIAEFTMSFPKVAFIIDCGLDCTKCFVQWGGVLSLQNHWISTSTAIQRQIRIGDATSAICFRLFSRIRYQCMGVAQTIHKGYLLEEACIQARLLAFPALSVETMLSTVPKPPSSKLCNLAIQTLIDIDALSNPHELTELGYHICDIPISPRYAKMVLVSVALKCLDPILTIACILAYAEPFSIPRSSSERRDWRNARKKFASESYSDHMMLLRAFQFWQKARSEGWEKSFCQKNFISSAAFEIITVIRTQLLGQLRASGFVKARGSGDIRDLNTNSENWAVVKAAIVAGMHPQFARIDKEGHIRVVTDNENLVKLHPYSILASTRGNGSGGSGSSSLPSEWLVYDQMVTLPSSMMAATEDHQPNTFSHANSKTLNIHGNQTMLDSSTLGNTRETCRNYQNSWSTEDSNRSHHSNEMDVEFQSMKVVGCATLVSPVTVALMAGPMRPRPELLKELEMAINDYQTRLVAGNKGLDPGQIKIQPTNGDNTQLAFSNSTFPKLADIRIPGNRPHASSDTAGAFSETQLKGLNQNTESKKMLGFDVHSAVSEPESDSDSDEEWTTMHERYAEHLHCTRDLRQRCLHEGPGTKRNAVQTETGLHMCSERELTRPSHAFPLSNFERSAESIAQANSFMCHNPSTSLQENPILLRLDDKGILQFRMDISTAQFIIALRQKWQSLLLRRLRSPGKQSSPPDEIVLSVVVAVLTAEEHVLGLRQPSGVGARPRPMATELCNQVDSSGDGIHARTDKQTSPSQTSISTEMTRWSLNYSCCEPLGSNLNSVTKVQQLNVHNPIFQSEAIHNTSKGVGDFFSPATIDSTGDVLHHW